MKNKKQKIIDDKIKELSRKERNILNNLIIDIEELKDLKAEIKIMLEDLK